MYVHIGIVGRDRTTQLSLALLVIVSDSVTLGERTYNRMPRSQGAPRIASIAKGTTQKSHGYTTPGAKVTCTPRARPRLAHCSPSASLTFRWHERSTHRPAAKATRSLRKLWLAPLSMRVRPGAACPVPPLNYRSNLSSSCWPTIPAELPMHPSMGCGQ